MIGKGNELRQLPMFGIDPGRRWDALAEKHELLRRRWREESLTWSGEFRTPLDAVATTLRGRSQTRPRDVSWLL